MFAEILRSHYKLIAEWQITTAFEKSFWRRAKAIPVFRYHCYGIITQRLQFLQTASRWRRIARHLWSSYKVCYWWFRNLLFRRRKNPNWLKIMHIKICNWVRPDKRRLRERGKSEALGSSKLCSAASMVWRRIQLLHLPPFSCLTALWLSPCSYPTRPEF